jgi:predicted phage tail protein
MGETIITGLKPGTDYSFQVTPINFWHVAGAPSVEVVHGTPEDTYAPSVPTIITTIVQGRHLHVAVDPITAADFAGFEFHASTVNGFTPSSATLKQQGDSTTCEFMGTGDSQTWYIRVRAYDTSGNASNYTAQASLTTAAFNPDDTTAPAVPPGLTLATGVDEDADGSQRVY